MPANSGMRFLQLCYVCWYPPAHPLTLRNLSVSALCVTNGICTVHSSPLFNLDVPLSPWLKVLRPACLSETDSFRIVHLHFTRVHERMKPRNEAKKPPEAHPVQCLPSRKQAAGKWQVGPSALSPASPHLGNNDRVLTQGPGGERTRRAGGGGRGAAKRPREFSQTSFFPKDSPDNMPGL